MDDISLTERTDSITFSVAGRILGYIQYASKKRQQCYPTITLALPCYSTLLPYLATLLPSSATFLPCYPSALPCYPSALPCYPSTLPYYPSALPCYPSALPYYLLRYSATLRTIVAKHTQLRLGCKAAIPCVHLARYTSSYVHNLRPTHTMHLKTFTP